MTSNTARATTAQHRAMWALWHRHGVTDRRNLRLAITSGIVHRVVSSSTALTRDEASRVIDRLQDTDGPPGVKRTRPEPV